MMNAEANLLKGLACRSIRNRAAGAHAAKSASGKLLGGECLRSSTANTNASAQRTAKSKENYFQWVDARLFSGHGHQKLTHRKSRAGDTHHATNPVRPKIVGEVRREPNGNYET